MEQKVISTKNMSREEWLAVRRKGIGGSDAGAVAGVSKYASPIKVFLEKTGQIESEEIFTVNEQGGFESGSEAAYFGVLNEDAVAQEFARRTGLKVRKKNAIIIHPEHDFIYANVDRLIIGKNEGLECKTASEYLKNEWVEEEVPATYLLQCQHYMAVTGAAAWHIAVLIGGNKFVHKRIERDEELIEQLIGIEVDFWMNHVLANIPPLFDGSQDSTDLLKAMYPSSLPETSIELPDDAELWVKKYKALEAKKKEIEADLAQCQNVLKEKMQENEVAYAGEQKITWKTQSSTRIDSKRLKEEAPDVFKKFAKTSESRVFRIK